MEKFKFIEPELIKEGSDKLRLGLMRYAPKVDCRVLSEDTYQELKKAYDLMCGGETSDESAALPLHDVMAMLPTNEEIQFHIEKHTRHNNGEAAMDEQTFYEGAKWLKAEFCKRVEGN